MLFLKQFISLILVFYFLNPYSLSAALSCTVTTTCNSPDAVIARLSATTNAHGELPGQSNYAQLVCCTNTGIGNSCSGNNQVVAHLSATTNAQAEIPSQSNYANNLCISDSSLLDNIVVATQASNCTGYDTTVMSISSATNAHLGNASAYNTKICASIYSPSLTLAINDSSIGFGNLSSTTGRWASGDTLGADAIAGTLPDFAHSVTFTTNAPGGFEISYIGDTLKSGANSISAATITPGDSDGTPGTSQFAISASTNGSSTIASGYARTTNATWNFVPNTTTTLISNTAAVTSSEIMRVAYLANITPTTPGGIYQTSITYILSGTF